jgi:multiple sugar transport system permease protein
LVIFLAATTVKVKEPKRSRALVRQETIASYLFLLPSLIFFLGFVIYPMILCVVTSFFDSTMSALQTTKSCSPIRSSWAL